MKKEVKEKESQHVYLIINLFSKTHQTLQIIDLYILSCLFKINVLLLLQMYFYLLMNLDFIYDSNTYECW